MSAPNAALIASAQACATKAYPMLEGWIPSSVGAVPVEEKIRIAVAIEKTELPIKRVLSNSFAFGGNNTSVLLRSA